MQKRRKYGYISEYFNDEWGEIYILKPPLVSVVKANLINQHFSVGR